MSDYGDDDFSDYDDYFYVEDEYTAADELAEHVVHSPPPTAYGDDDDMENWDRFDYFNDLEYGSDGYDEDVITHKSQGAQVGQKRKRGSVGGHSKKKRKVGKERAVSGSGFSKPLYPPVVWRSQADRQIETKQLDKNAEPYALLKDWRERLADTPTWTAGTLQPKSPKKSSRKGKATRVSQPISSTVEDENDYEDEEDGDGGVDPTVLMEALQKNLAAAGGPLNGMDPQQLLQFAMRMMSNQDTGDEIAGELAEDMLMQGDEDGEEGEGEAPADLVDWLSKQKGSSHVGPSDPDEAPGTGIPKSPEINHRSRKPPTPPSSEANRSHRGKDTTRKESEAALKESHAIVEAAPETLNRKRKANEAAEVADNGKASKKRATRSYDAPTAASQAKAVPASRATRSAHTKR